MTGKTLVILAASIYQVPFIRRAKQLGYRVATCDNRPENPGHALADVHANIDTTDAPAVTAFAKWVGAHGILAAATDVALPSVAYAARALGLSGPSEEAVAILCDKPAFRVHQQKTGLPHPEFIVLSPNTDAPPLGGPWLVKPDRSSGSKGVALAMDEQELKMRVDEARAHALGGDVVLERFIEGQQGTLEGVAEKGRIVASLVTDRLTAPAPFVATQGHRTPSSLQPKQISALRDQVQKVTQYFELDGPFDCDFVATQSDCYILEVSPRAGGNAIAQLVEAATGFDWRGYVVSKACGDARAIEREWSVRPTGLVILGVNREGRLTYNSEQVGALRAEPWMLDFALDTVHGALVKPFTDGRHRIGQAIFTASSRAELDARAEDVATRLQVRAI